MLRLEGDVILYALGTGEYDELNCEDLSLKCCSLLCVCSLKALFSCSGGNT